MNNSLITSVNSLYVDTYLGVSAAERSKKQQVKISFKLYQKHPEAFNDDNTELYHCYAKLVEEIKSYCLEAQCKLLEYFCYQIYKLVKSRVGKDTGVYISVQKMGIRSGDTTFDAQAEYSD